MPIYTPPPAPEFVMHLQPDIKPKYVIGQTVWSIAQDTLRPEEYVIMGIKIDVTGRGTEGFGKNVTKWEYDYTQIKYELYKNHDHITRFEEFIFPSKGDLIAYMI